MEKKGYFFLTLSILIFSTMEIANKFIVNDFHPLQLNFLRFFIGAICLLPFAVNHIIKNKIKLSLKEIIMLILLGAFAVPVSMSFFQLSVLYTKASILAVIISANAVFVAPFSYFILKEKIDKFILISLICGIAGMVIIAFPSSGMAGSDIIGILYAIAASVTFALFTVMGKKISSRYGGLILNTFVFLSGSLLMIPILMLAKIPIFSGVNSHNIPYVLYIGISVTAAGYIFLFKGLSYLPANRGSLVFFAKPPLAGILAYIVLGETFSLNLTLGTIAILGGILFIIAPRKNVEISKEA